MHPTATRPPARIVRATPRPPAPHLDAERVLPDEVEEDERPLRGPPVALGGRTCWR